VEAASREGSPRQINRGLLYLFGALGGILFGYDIGVVGGALLFLEKDWHLHDVNQSLVGSALAAGAMVGAFAASRLIERSGRRRTIMFGTVIFGLGTLGCVLSTGLDLLVALRFIAGIGIGLTSATIPAYLDELAPARSRGALASLNQLMIASGSTLAFVVDWALSGSGSWRLMFGVALAPALILLVALQVLPETPRWLLQRGREVEARAVIRAAQGKDADVDAEVEAINEVIQLDSEQHGTLRDLIGWARPALVVALILVIGQQFCGVNAVAVYAPTMFKDVGLSTSNSLLDSAWIGIAKVIFVVITIFVVDRWGRRPLLFLGSIGMTVFLVATGVVVLTIHSTSASGIAAMICIIGYLATYELGWGALVWVMIGEVFPLKVRGIGVGVSSTVLWAGTFAITFLFPVMNTNLHLWGAVFVFAALCLIFLALVARFVPETSGRSLEQVETEMRGRMGVENDQSPAVAATNVHQ
jgi:sugar porter (SP) family MFS transporter